MPNTWHFYTVTLQHDAGRVRIKTAATGYKSAIDKVCRAEFAPESAVVAIERGKEI